MKTEDKNDGDTVSFDNSVQLQVDEKEVLLKEKELIEIENNFQQQININDDASKDGLITLSVKPNSSEMITEFELHGKLNEGIFFKNDIEIDNNMFKDLSVKH